MSKEEYLKGERKEKALEIIRYCIATRCTNGETQELLKNKGFPIAERTLRRYKSELYQSSGFSAFHVFQKRVGEHILDDILGFEELEREGWKILKSSTTVSEKVKVLSVLQSVKTGKFRILKSYPLHGPSSTCED